MCGTPEYLAPEMLNRKGHGTAVDWWSLGMVIYELLTGLPPWYTTDRKKLFQRIKLAPLTFPESVSPPAKSLISGMMNRDPSQRLGTDIETLKSHIFFKGLDWDDVYHKRLEAPYKPCAMTKDELDASLQNFEKQFTKMALQSEAEPTDLAYTDMKSTAEGMFTDFTYEDESTPVKNTA
jgi:serine/threonine protein kinase